MDTDHRYTFVDVKEFFKKSKTENGGRKDIFLAHVQGSLVLIAGRGMEQSSVMVAFQVASGKGTEKA